jgi:LAS superfamily LD-carboxypeptidase LdcB
MRTQAELDSLRSSLRRAVVDAYVHGEIRSVSVIFEAASVSAAARRQALYDTAVNRATDVADRLRATREDLGVRRAEADAAQAEAVSRRLEEEASLAGLEKAEAAQQKVADELEKRLDEALAEADALEAVDHQLAAQIAAREAAVAARIANRRVGAGAGRRGSRIGAVQVTSVRGIVVNVQVADQLAALLGAADAAGLSLSGGGYRDPQAQIALRAAHCGGSSDYAIYDKPPSQCHPPTARPGNSMHELGLAIDFTSGGHIMASRSDPAYRWLKANATRYGLHNLSSEPWHWSTNGN